MICRASTWEHQAHRRASIRVLRFSCDIVDGCLSDPGRADWCYYAENFQRRMDIRVCPCAKVPIPALLRRDGVARCLATRRPSQSGAIESFGVAVKTTSKQGQALSGVRLRGVRVTHPGRADRVVAPGRSRLTGIDRPGSRSRRPVRLWGLGTERARSSLSAWPSCEHDRPNVENPGHSGWPPHRRLR